MKVKILLSTILLLTVCVLSFTVWNFFITEPSTKLETQDQTIKMQKLQEKIDSLEERMQSLEKSQNDLQYQLNVGKKISDLTGLSPKVSNTLIVECKNNGAPLPIMLAIYEKESHFNPAAFNPSSHATGLGQILPSTARGVCSRSGEHYLPSKLKDPEYNIKLTTYYLMNDVYRWRKNWSVALYTYSGGSKEYAKDVLERSKYYEKMLKSR